MCVKPTVKLLERGRASDLGTNNFNLFQAMRDVEKVLEFCEILTVDSSESGVSYVVYITFPFFYAVVFSSSGSNSSIAGSFTSTWFQT